jgi:DNA topoisomerase-1
VPQRREHRRGRGGKAEARPDEPTGQLCPRCGNGLVRRHGRFGAYVSCSNYPACKYKPPKPIKDTGVRCPKDGGILAERRGRFRAFYGCVNYPNCDFSLSVRPIPEACPQCGNPYLLYRERKSGNALACDKAGCGFEKPAPAPEALPPIVEFTPEAPPDVPDPVVVAAAAKKPRARRAAKA